MYIYYLMKKLVQPSNIISPLSNTTYPTHPMNLNYHLLPGEFLVADHTLTFQGPQPDKSPPHSY